jgi:hypothetical protein
MPFEQLSRSAQTARARSAHAWSAEIELELHASPTIAGMASQVSRVNI